MLQFVEIHVVICRNRVKTLHAKRAKKRYFTCFTETLKKGTKKSPESATKLMRFSEKNRKIAEISGKNKTPF